MAGTRGAGFGLNQQGGSWPELTNEQRARVEANTALVHWHLRRRQTPPHEYEDRLQDGLLGLMRAAQLYNPAKGFTFATYALFWVRQSVTRGREIEHGSNVRLAANRGDEYFPPLSLDGVTIDGGEEVENLTLAGILAAPVDVADDVTDELATTDLIARITAHVCRDHVDRAIVAAWADGTKLAKVAERHGITGNAIRWRAARVGSRLRHPTLRHVTEGIG